MKSEGRGIFIERQQLRTEEVGDERLIDPPSFRSTQIRDARIEIVDKNDEDSCSVYSEGERVGMMEQGGVEGSSRLHEGSVTVRLVFLHRRNSLLLLLLLLERSELLMSRHGAVLVMLLLKMLTSHLLLHVRRTLLTTEISSHLSHLRHVMTGMLHELMRRRMHAVHELSVVVATGDESGMVGVSRHMIRSFSLNLALNSFSVRRVSNHRCDT